MDGDLREKKQLQKTTITIKTPIKITEETIKYHMNLIKHHLTECGSIISYEVDFIPDDRNLPDPPKLCQLCVYCVNKECWYSGDYYGQDWVAGDCFEAKNRSI